jgi:3-oxoacyl-[acyl-carrier-protein] synthase III
MPVELGRAVCARNGISLGDVTLISHEASQHLTDAWAEGLKPRAYLRELPRLGHVPGAIIPIILSLHLRTVTTDHVLLLAPGTGAHFAAALISRAEHS